MPALVPIRFGSSPEGTPRRPLVAGVSSGGSCVVGPISGTTPFDGLSPTAMFSASRKLRAAYAGDIYLADGLKRINTLYDQSGSNRDLTGLNNLASSPTVVCFDSNPANALQYVSGDILRSVGTPLGDFISATDGYMIATVNVTSVVDSNPSPFVMLMCGNWPLNPAGLFMEFSGPQIAAYNNFSGQRVGTNLVLDVTHVFEWRHEGGVLYLRVDGAAEVSVAAGNTSALTLADALNLGGQFLSFGLNGYIWEAALFSVVPDLTTRNALVQDMGLWAGAAV